MSLHLLSRCLLLAASGDAQAEFVAGDLEEEFAELAETRGRIAAERWLFRQTLNSILPLLEMRVRSGELTHAFLMGLAAAGLPLWICDRFWAFLYSQIPLKDGVGRAPWQFALTLACLSIGAALAGATARTPQRAGAVAASATVMACVALTVATGATPPVYVVLALLLAPAGSLVFYVGRRLS